MFTQLLEEVDQLLSYEHLLWGNGLLRFGVFINVLLRGCEGEVVRFDEFGVDDTKCN